MRIGIDIDGVLADITAAVLPIVNREIGGNITKRDIENWWYVPQKIGESKGGLAEKSFLDMMDEAWMEGNVPLEEPNLVNAVKKLRKKGHEITIITRRTFRSHPFVVRWLHDQGFRYDILTFSGHESKLVHPIDVLLDDAPSIVEQALVTEKRVYLRDQPWNRKLVQLPWNVTRVKDFADFAEHIGRLR